MKNNIQQRIHSVHHSRIFRYLLIGGTAFLTEYGVFYLLYQEAHIQLYVANSISFFCGLIVSFVFNRSWTFKAGTFTHRAHKQLIMYVVLALFNLGMINLLVGLLKHINVDPRIGKVIGQLTIVLWNFFIYRKIIFVSELIEPS